MEVDPASFERVLKLANELTNLLVSIRGSTATVSSPPDVADKLSRRVCLVCGKKVVEGDRYVRGQCNDCERDTRDEVSAHLVTEGYLIAHGKLALPSPGGRKRKRKKELKKYLESAKAVEQYSADNQGPNEFDHNTRAVDESAAEIDALIEADAAEQRAKKAAEREATQNSETSALPRGVDPEKN